MATKGWGETKTPTGGSGDDIRRIQLSKLDTGKGVTVRLVGGVLPNFLYWLKNKDGKPRTRNATNFNRETEEWDKSIVNPVEQYVMPQDSSVKPQFGYVTNVIERETGKVHILELKQTVYKQIRDYALKTGEYGDPTDPDTGYDFTIEKVKTGPKIQNVKYTLFPSRSNTPLSEEEKAMELYDLEKLYKQETPDEQIQWLRENTNYLDVGSEIPSESNDETTPNDDVPWA